MKLLLLFCFGIARVTLAQGTGFQEADICGRWYTENNESIIEILKDDDGSFIGKIVWMAEPNETDKSNPNYGNPVIDEFTKEPLMGSLVLYEIKYKGENTWEDGFAYDCRKGKKYNCSVQLSDDKKTLKLTGYFKTKLLGKTVEWKRVGKIL